MKKNILYILIILLNTACHISKNSTTTKVKSKTELLKEKYALQLQTTPNEIKNIPLYTFIDANLGTPYLYGGNSYKGYDCSGLTQKLYAVIYKKEIPRNSIAIAKVSNKIKKRQLKEGDLVFFKINSKKVSHVGVYLLNDYFIHASSSKGVIISNLNESYYKKYFWKGGAFNVKR